MSMEKSVRPARMIVVGNEKGGSGKSTVAMHVAVALIKARQTVATIDLDSRQKSLTHYVDNRRAWSHRIGRELDVPTACVSRRLGRQRERTVHGFRRYGRCSGGTSRLYRHRYARA